MLVRFSSHKEHPLQSKLAQLSLPVEYMLHKLYLWNIKYVYVFNMYLQQWLHKKHIENIFGKEKITDLIPNGNVYSYTTSF